jgi:ParB family chromosome partitioning protein
MRVADKLKKVFGGNLNESLGVRGPVPGEAAAAPSPAAIPATSPDDGRTRARDAGHMEIERIVPDPNQPRKEFTKDSIDRLAASIKERGQLLPLRVRWNQELGKWVIVSGERRYRAALQAGLKTVSCIFIDRELTEAECLQEQLVENALREDLRPSEQAKAYKSLSDMNGWSANELADALHVSKSAVIKALALLKLPEDIQRQVDSGEIPATAAYEVARLDGEEEQRELAERIISEKLTRDATVEAVRVRKNPARLRQPSAAPPELAGAPAGTTISYTLADGTRVAVTSPRKPFMCEQVCEALKEALRLAEMELAMKARPAA